MRYVRWKQYGFTHIIAEGRVHPRWGGMATLCGNDVRLWWMDSGVFNYLTPERREKELAKFLPPSEQNDNKRPLCGACKKIADNQKNRSNA